MGYCFEQETQGVELGHTRNTPSHPGAGWPARRPRQPHGDCLYSPAVSRASPLMFVPGTNCYYLFVLHDFGARVAKIRKWSKIFLTGRKSASSILNMVKQ